MREKKLTYPIPLSALITGILATYSKKKQGSNKNGTRKFKVETIVKRNQQMKDE